MECTACGLWALDASDGFCGFCGRPIITCDIDIQKVVLITGQQMQKPFTITNRGDADVYVDMRADIDGVPVSFYPPTQRVNIGKSGVIEISLDPTALELPAPLVTGHIVCRLEGSEQRSIRIPLTVKAGPKAQISPEAIDFNEVNAGSVRQTQINIHNLGGVPLGIHNILCEGLPEEYFEIRHQDAVWTAGTKLPVDPGATLPLTLVMNLKSRSIAQREFDGAVLIHFTNHKPLALRIPVSARVFSCSCDIEPKELKIDPCPSGGRASLRFRLLNDGSSDLKVKAVETDQPWLTVPGGENGFDLLTASRGEPKREPGPGQFLLERETDLLVDAAQLPEGEHTASLLVHVTNVPEPFRFPVSVNVVKPLEYKEYIGIDFGTTNSVVAINDPRQGMILLKVKNRLGEPTELIPSVLVFKGSLESSVFGYEAENAMVLFPENTVRSIKRIMGCNRQRTYFGQELAPSVLAGMILKKLVALAELTFYRETGQYYSFRRAIITVPANFYGVQIQDMLKACQDAGLDAGRTAAATGSPAEGPLADIILKEPTAGAIFCMSRLYKEPQFRKQLTEGKPLHLLVFDYGGGTVDISLVRAERPRGSGLELTCIATKGDNKIGGEGMTLGLMEEMLGKCAAANPAFDKSLILTRHSDLEKRRRAEGWGPAAWSKILWARSTWKALAEETKLLLSQNDQTVFRVPGEAIIALTDRGVSEAESDYSYTLDREEFELLIGSFLDKSKKLVTDVIAKARAKAGFGADEPVADYVLHTGRASLMPAVLNAVREALPSLTDEQIILRPDLLKHSVARGAALFGSIRQGPGTDIRVNAQDNTLPYSYGYHRFDLFERVFVPIIPADCPCCTRVEAVFGPEEFSNGRLQLTFYRNSGTDMVIDDNPEVQPIGDVTVDQAEAGSGCTVVMHVDAYGILKVEVDGREIPLKEFREEDDSWDA